MQRFRTMSTFAVALVFLVTAPSVTAHQKGRQLVHDIPRRSALVIGNGAYAAAPLRNPVNDARDVAAKLRSLGFAVTLGENWTQRQMENGIRAFGDQLRRGGVGLFYYAGHGVQVGGRNYLIPVDARIETESDVAFESVDAGRAFGKMEDAGNGFNIVILDACRNNPFGRGFRDAQQGLAQVTAPTGSFIAYATAPGSVASDGSGRNGTYTSALLEALDHPGLKVEDLFKRVRERVARETASQQVPWDSSSLVGDFYFVGGPGPRAPRARRPWRLRSPLRRLERVSMPRQSYLPVTSGTVMPSRDFLTR